MAGLVEAVVQQHTHRGDAKLGAEEVIQISNADTRCLSSVLSVDLAGEVGFKKLHRFLHTRVELLVGPSGGWQVAQSVNNKAGGLPVVGFALRGVQGFEEALADFVDGVSIDPWDGE